MLRNLQALRKPVFKFRPMDPQPTASDYLNAETCVSILSHNLALAFQIENGAEWPREKMQKHVTDRAALLRVQALLVDEAERIYQQ